MRIALSLLALTVGGCASNALVLDGESRGKTLDLRLAGRIEGGSGKVKLDVENHANDAIAIDLDAIRLGDPSPTATGVAPLGKPQSFRSEDGKKVMRRVSLGTAAIGPNSKQQIELEFERVPSSEAYALALPTVYRMGIEGQVSLKGMRLPVHVEKRAIEVKNPDGWFDPFEDY
jgi:hypothetical protein